MNRVFSQKLFPISRTGLVFAGVAALAAGVAVMTSCTRQEANAKVNMVFKPSPKPGIVAKIGDETITEDVLIGEDKYDFFELKKREYDLKMERLNKLLIEKIIGADAKQASMSLDDFINKKVIGADIKISDKDFKKFVADKKIPEGQINPQIKERIIDYLKNQKRQDLVQAYLAKKTKEKPVEVYLDKPRIKVEVDIAGAPVWGKAEAGVTVVEFSDFQCPFCTRAADTVAQLKKKYAGKIKIAFKHFPLPMHKDARGAAEASMCVNEQSTDKFWKYHDIMFKNQDKLDAASLEKYAKDVGADVKKYTECVTSKKMAAVIDKDMAEGEKKGVKATPMFFINGQPLSGAVPIESFSEVIDDELDSAKKSG